MWDEVSEWDFSLPRRAMRTSCNPILGRGFDSKTVRRFGFSREARMVGREEVVVDARSDGIEFRLLSRLHK